MGNLKRSYSKRLGVAMHTLHSLRFLYNGKRIPDDATPGMLEMERLKLLEALMVFFTFLVPIVGTILRFTESLAGS